MLKIKQSAAILVPMKMFVTADKLLPVVADLV